MTSGPLGALLVAAGVSLGGLAVVHASILIAGHGIAGKALAAVLATAWLALCAPWLNADDGGASG